MANCSVKNASFVSTRVESDMDAQRKAIVENFSKIIDDHFICLKVFLPRFSMMQNET